LDLISAPENLVFRTLSCTALVFKYWLVSSSPFLKFESNGCYLFKNLSLIALSPDEARDSPSLVPFTGSRFSD
jgi:hypothetical protein